VMAVAAAIAAAPVWLAASASGADLVVTFHGQPDITSTTVSCPSRPDVMTLSVPSGTTVKFVNQLGVAATLWSTDSHEDLGAGDMVPVTFTGGAASIVMEMLPKCTLDVGTHVSMTVVVQSASAGSSPAASPNLSGASAAPPATPRPSGSVASASPSATGRTSGTKHHASPSSSRQAAVSGAGNGGDADPIATGAESRQAAYVTFGTPVSADSRHGASGLLTLIATVFVGGVSAAVIRAIMAQRSTFPSR